MNHPALALVEITSVARGMVVCDALVKRAIVEVLRAHPVDPGKYNILFVGPVAEVEEAMDAAEEAAAGTMLDRLLLPNVHEAVVPAIRGAVKRPEIVALGIVETHTMAGSIVGLDAALKAAEVEVVELRLAAGLAGKGYFVVTGEQHDVEAALEAAVERAGSDVMTEIIPRPHPDFLKGAF